MSDRWILSTDPREGEWPEEPPDYCPHGIDQHEADCGRCLRDELSADDVLGAALVAMLKKIQEREDEAMGAALAARFEKDETTS
jgi:hypothetical protein